MDLLNLIMTVTCSVIASSGFWAFFQKRLDKNDAKTKLLIGVAHDRIVALATEYIERGCITNDEYENLNDYLFVPYKEAGGNGTAAKLMKEVDKIPIRQRGCKGDDNDADE